MRLFHLPSVWRASKSKRQFKKLHLYFESQLTVRLVVINNC